MLRSYLPDYRKTLFKRPGHLTFSLEFWGYFTFVSNKNEELYNDDIYEDLVEYENDWSESPKNEEIEGNIEKIMNNFLYFCNTNIE